jgi:hypothetical protein
MRPKTRATQNFARVRVRTVLAVGLTLAVVAFPIISAAGPNDTATSTVCTAPTPTPTPTTPEPSPTRNPTPTPTPTPEPEQRTVTVTADKTIVDFRGSVTLSGELTSADGTCRIGEKVQIVRQVLGEEEQRGVGKLTTGDLGEFSTTTQVQASAMYFAIAEETKTAAEATSEPVTVLGRVSIGAQTRSLNPERGSKFEITARVVPAHPGSFAKLERKNEAGNWFKVDKDKADDRSAFSYKVKANWKGKRVYRVTWLKSDEDHEPDTSNKLKIRPKKPQERGGRSR